MCKVADSFRRQSVLIETPEEVTKSLQYKEFTATLTEQAWSIKNLLFHIYQYPLRP